MNKEITAETKYVKENFDLNKVLEFQLHHDIEVRRVDNYTYGCIIDGEPYSTCMLTPMCALVTGIVAYKQFNATT